MAIKCNLSTLMGKNRYNMQDVNIQRIDFETLNKLCELFDCQVGDLIEYIKE